MLRVNDLTISFSDNVVLNGLSFAIQQGDSLGIVGESGSGKSITALAIIGLLPHNASINSGEALYTPSETENSIDLLSIPEQEHRLFRGKHIAMIFQEPMTSLNPSMRCGRQVLEAINIHQNLHGHEAKKVCLKLFDEMQLPQTEKVFRSYPHEISGGQKQRVMIAMALAGNPKLLIADEPTTALDVTVQKEILQLLRELSANRGMGLIFISHDLGVISQITNRMIVLHKGSKVEEGDTQTLFKNPTHPYTKGLIACRPPRNVRPLKLTTVQDFISRKDVDSKFSRPISDEQWAGVNQKIYSNHPLLSVDNVSVNYVLRRNLIGKVVKSFSAVSSVSLNLYPGETLGLVGESGCGKTSLGRAMLGLTKTQSGTITYQGKVLQSMSTQGQRNFWRHVQIIFQDPYSSLNPRHTIGEALMEPLQVMRLFNDKHQRKRRVLELLDMVSLNHNSFYRYPHEFSGGQRQRLAIARALAVEPKIIVCDEMVSALDVSIQAQILNLLNDLKRELGLTYLFISHDLSVVKYMSNRMLIMKDGKMVEYGDSDDIFSNPSSEYTQKLIDAIP